MKRSMGAKEIHDGRVEARVIPATAACDEMKGDISQTGNQNRLNRPQSRARRRKPELAPRRFWAKASPLLPLIMHPRVFSAPGQRGEVFACERRGI